MTSTTSILELRQADSNVVNANGDYETLLSNDITLNNGDVLVLKNAFIDTKQTGNIVLDTDTTLTIQFMPYITDWLPTADKTNYTDRNGDGPIAPVTTFNTNGLDFVPYYYTVGGTVPGYESVIAVNYEYVEPPEPEPFLTTTYSYINIGGQTIIFHTQVFGPYGTPFAPVQDVLTNIIAKIGSFQLLTDPNTMATDGFGYAVVGPIIVVSPVTPTLNIWNPYIYSTNITIPAGNYSPTYISLYISEKLSQNNSQNLQQLSGLTQSPFLKRSEDYDAGKPMPNGALNPDGSPIIVGAEGTMFIATDNSLKFNFGYPNLKYFIGTSQIALEFDTDSNKFVWQFLHFPMLDNVSGTNISVRYQYYLNNNNPATNPIIATAKNGGIFLTGLSSVDTNGNQTNFWTNTLGFNLSKICVNSHAGYIGGILGLDGNVQTLGPTSHGVNMTTGFAGLDTIVFKDKDRWWYENLLNSFDDSILCSTINNTIALEASNSIDELLNKYSHFLIQVNFTLSNNYIGTDTFRNIGGIISKYYSDANYTFGASDGAIQYIHNGAPVQIKSLKVRILNSSKMIDPLLGPDNTVIFEVIKQAPVKK
jgi:hypothetical protein